MDEWLSGVGWRQGYPGSHCKSSVLHEGERLAPTGGVRRLRAGGGRFRRGVGFSRFSRASRHSLKQRGERRGSASAVPITRGRVRGVDGFRLCMSSERYEAKVKLAPGGETPERA